jgi:hypothetical protein
MTVTPCSVTSVSPGVVCHARWTLNSSTNTFATPRFARRASYLSDTAPVAAKLSGNSACDVRVQGIGTRHGIRRKHTAIHYQGQLVNIYQNDHCFLSQVVRIVTADF